MSQRPPVDPALLVGPNSEYVKLVASDGTEFDIKRSLAYISPTLHQMLINQGKEGQKSVLHLRLFSPLILETVCNYLEYYNKNVNMMPCPEGLMNQGNVLEIVLASEFLKC